MTDQPKTVSRFDHQPSDLHRKYAIAFGLAMLNIEDAGFEWRLGECSLDPQQLDLHLHDTHNGVSLEVLHPYNLEQIDG